MLVFRKVLLANQANINFTNKDKENGLYIAASFFNTNVTDYLEVKGIKETKPLEESQAERNRNVLNKTSTDAMLNDINNNNQNK